MRRGTLKFITYVALGSFATPFSVEADPKGEPGTRDNFQDLRSGRSSNSSGFQNFGGQQFQSGPQEFDSNGQLISQQVNDLRSAFGGQGPHGIQDQFGSGREVLENQSFPANFFLLARDAFDEGSTLHPNDFVIGLDRRVKNLQSAASSKDVNAAGAASSELWRFLQDNGMHRRFLDESGKKVRIDDLGLALCVDGETPTGLTQEWLEKGFANKGIDFVNQVPNSSYSLNTDPGNGVASSALAGATIGITPDGSTRTALTELEDSTTSASSSPARSARVPSSDSASSPVRPPQGFDPAKYPIPLQYPSCANQPLGNNNNENRDRDQAKNNNDDKNKNPGEKNPGNPKSPPPEDPPPQFGGAQGGGGGEPPPLDKVDIAKGGPAQPFRGPNAEADNFNYLQAIADAGKFEDNYDFGKIISGMEQSNLQYLQQRAQFLAATPIVRYGGGVPGGQSAAASNQERLRQLAGGSSNRDQPFNGLFGQ